MRLAMWFWNHPGITLFILFCIWIAGGIIGSELGYEETASIAFPMPFGAFLIARGGYNTFILLRLRWSPKFRNVRFRDPHIRVPPAMNQRATVPPPPLPMHQVTEARKGWFVHRLKRLFLQVVLAVMVTIAVIPGVSSLLVPVIIVLGKAIDRTDTQKERYLWPTAAEVRAVDPRAPVVILRSFRDEFVEVLMLRGRGMHGSNTLEALIAERLRAHGPVIAVGKPNETLPPIGASRCYFAAECWRDEVRELLHQAQLIVVIMGATAGLGWELELLATNNLLHRTLVICPPGTPQQQVQRWARLKQSITHLMTPAWLAEEVPAGLLAAVFPTQGECAEIVGDYLYGECYQEAVSLGIRMIQHCGSGTPA